MPDAPFDLRLFRARISALAEHNVFVGTSSWKYEGWNGQVYTPSRYEYRGKFAKTRFERECLGEYGETFSTVCVDAAYYDWPDERRLREMSIQVPDNFRFAFKVTDAVTIRQFPNLPRFGQRAGVANPDFLRADLFAERFLGPMEAIRGKVGPIIFEFSKFYQSDYKRGTDFITDLDRFFGALPKTWRFGVELRNRSWLGPEYLGCLSRHGVAHVFNNWSDMPPISEQLVSVGGQEGSDSTVARFLLRPGRKYEEAVNMFQPYERTQEVNEDARAAMATLLEQGWHKARKTGTFVYVNNRLEGNAPMTIFAVLNRLTSLPLPTSAPPAPAPSSQATPVRPSPPPQLDLGLSV